MRKIILLASRLCLLLAVLTGCSNNLGQAHYQYDGIVGLWQGEVEIWEGNYTTVQLEFFSNGLTIVSRHDGLSGDAFGWRQGDGVLYIDDLSGAVQISLHEGEAFQPTEPQAISYEISGNLLTIEWDAGFLGSLSGEYTRQPTLPLDSRDNHPLLGTWEFPSAEWLNARGVWDVETFTFLPDGTGIAAVIMEMEYREEMNFLWMARGNQVYQIMGGTAQIVDFRVTEGRLHLGGGNEEIVLRKQ